MEVIVKHAEVHDAHDPELIARYNCSALKVRRRDILVTRLVSKSVQPVAR
jgi:hypothetical protein